MSQSLYSSMGNNPIKFSDPFGDTVRVDNSITGNKLLNSSFNAFSRTKEGRKFLANYAAKGQAIGGYTFKKDGKYSKQGVDLNYNSKSFDKDKGGETSKSIDASGRGQITVSVNSNFYEKTVHGLVGEAVGKIGTLFHESFIHADLHTNDFLDNKQFDYSNIGSSVKNAAGVSRHYHHYKVLQDFVNKGYNSGNLWPHNAFNGMKEINDALKVYKSDQEMINQMWNYDGGVELDDRKEKTINMRKAILSIGLFFANCNANEKLFKLHFEEIDYTYDSGWKVAYSMKIYKSGLLLVGEGRWSKNIYSGKISESKLKSLDSLLMLVPFKQYDSLYEAEKEDQSSYKLVIPNFNKDSVKVFVYGNAAPRLLDSISNVLRSLKENTELHAKDTSLVFLSLQNFYPLPVKKTE